MRWVRVAVPVPVFVLMLASISVSAQSTVGYRDFSFGTIATGTPTGEKPESKLWFNDGVWWGSLFNTTTSTYHIYRFNASTQSWTDTGTQLDNRPSTKADCLWDGSVQKLYVASHVFNTNGSVTSSSSQWGRVYRYSYHSGTQSYTLDSGFPVTVNKGNSETMIIAKDTTGLLWVTFTQGSKVYVNHSAVGNDAQWGTPFLPPTNNNNTSLTSDDISSAIAFRPGNIGVMWSNQLTHKFYFMVHRDGDADTVWQPEETAFPLPGGTENSDDHINLKTDNTGRVFAAVKTSLTGSTDPLIELIVRATDGTWSNYVFGLKRDSHSRPIVLLDLEHSQVYMFAVSPEGGTNPQAIYYKTSSLSAISFQSGLGTPFIKNPTDVDINNASSTKQNVDSSTGLLVISSDQNTRYYQHNFLTLGGTQPAVSISSFTPTSGDIGTMVTLNGSGFTGTTSVTFNSASASFGFISDSKLTAVVPAGAATGLIQVTTPAGTGTSSSNFVVIVAPSITSFTPTSGPVGTTVTITGSGFTGASAVTFAGVAASFTVNRDTQITATVPTGSLTGPIQVTNSAGTATSSSNFVVTVPPSITSFTPTNGPVGTTVTITGSGFTGASAVSFAGVAASFAVNSDTQITATVPTNGKTGVIQVTTPAGTGTSSSNFVVTSPSIASFTPTSGPVGTTVTITGSGFTGTTAVRFAGVAASFTVNSDTQITATVPTGATTGLIQVTNPSGTATSSSNFVVTAPPSITSFTPTSGPVGTTVTITGSGFTGTTAVRFAGVAASFTLNSDTQITATVPTGATTGLIQVTNPSGTATTSSNFVVTVPPSITAFTPKSGPVGTTVTITGSGFTGATAVRFAGLAASFTVNTDTQITAIVPSGATTGQITVSTPSGVATSSTSFKVTRNPSISSFTPTSGPVGTVVTVRGSGFTGTTSVTFNGVSATYKLVSDSKLTAVVPAAATTGPIQVTNPGGTATSSTNFVVQ